MRCFVGCFVPDVSGCGVLFGCFVPDENCSGVVFGPLVARFVLCLRLVDACFVRSACCAILGSSVRRLWGVLFRALFCVVFCLLENFVLFGRFSYVVFKIFKYFDDL